MNRLSYSDIFAMTPDKLRTERAWRQRDLAGGKVPIPEMHTVSSEVRAIDARLRELGEKSW